MTGHDLTLDELLERGWLLTPPAAGPGSTLSVTLVLTGPDGMLTHAVTGQGRTGDEARAKAIEIANHWRGLKAAARSREEGQTN